MAAYVKFYKFTDDLVRGIHDFDANTFKVMLTNTLPASPQNTEVKASLTEIAAGNGYTAGGTATTISIPTFSTAATGTVKVIGTDVEFIASGGSIGPFRYAILYNDSTLLAVDPLIAYWDYGSNLTLAAGEKLTVDFDATNGIFQIT